jgi:hypothetical protein
MKSKYKVALAAAAAALCLAAFTSASALATQAEFRPERAMSFTGHSVGEVSWELENGDIWTYSSATISGEINWEGKGELLGKLLKKVTLTFKEGGNGSCNTNNLTKELVWSKLEGYIGYTHKEPNEVGLALFTEGDRIGSSWAIGKCFSNAILNKTYKGVLVIPIASFKTEEFTHYMPMKESRGIQALTTASFAGNGLWGGIRVPLQISTEETPEKTTYVGAGIAGELTFETPERIWITG